MSIELLEHLERSGASYSRSSRRVLTLAFTGFTIAFAVWMMFGVLGVPIRKEFGLTPVQFSWLLAAATLGGALPRMWAGIMTDKYGGGGGFFLQPALVV